MSRFGAMFTARGRPKLLGQMGQTVRLESPGSSRRVAVTAIVGAIGTEEIESRDGGFDTKHTRLVTIANEEAAVTLRHTFYIADPGDPPSGAPWSVHDIVSRTETMTKVRVVRALASRRTAPETERREL